MGDRQSAMTRRSFLGTTAGAIGVVGFDATPQSSGLSALSPPGPTIVDMAVDAIVPRTPAAELSRFLERARQFGVGVAVTTVVGGEDWASALERIEAFTPLLQKFNLTHCRTVQEIDAAHRAGHTAVVYRTSGAYWLLSPHGGYPMISLFRAPRFAALRRLGVRVVQLTDDYKGLLGDGCSERTDCGLTDYGLWAIRLMNEEGLVIDCSHAGYRTSMEAVEASRDPVVFSSSNAFAVHAHKRNLRDDQIRAAAVKGGVIGINALDALVDSNAPVLSRVIDHVHHVARLVGVEHVMLGLGYASQARSSPGPKPADASTNPNPPRRYALQDYAELPALREGLRARGYGEEAVSQILGGNALRVFRTIWKQ
jgi:membrane dipeptidase